MNDTIFSPTALEGRVCLISGATRGIGAAVLEKFARAGAIVVGTATSEKGVASIEARIAELGAKGMALALDVCDTAACDAAVKAVTERFGRIDVLVNNAGITKDTLMMRMKDELWDAVIDTNLSGAFRLARAVTRPMMKARYGRIIQISSVVGAMGNPGQVNYASAKAGMLGLTKALAREIGSRGITVNAVAPGFIETDMTAALDEIQREHLMSQIPVGRLGQTDDVANACLFLASDAAAYVTGATLHVNGGMFTG